MYLESFFFLSHCFLFNYSAIPGLKIVKKNNFAIINLFKPSKCKSLFQNQSESFFFPNHYFRNIKNQLGNN